MSTDWDVYCLDCEEEAGFYDANHEIDLMREIVKHGPALAKACRILLELQPNLRSSYRLQVGYSEPRYKVDFKWWVEHGEHRLVARNEYGCCDGDCDEHYRCLGCESWLRCVLPKGHEGPHTHVKSKP